MVIYSPQKQQKQTTLHYCLTDQHKIIVQEQRDKLSIKNRIKYS